MAENVVSFEEALKIVQRHARPVPSAEVERVALLEAQGRVLAEPLVADRDQPPFDRSTRDGYAVRAAELAGRLRIAGQVRAGFRWEGVLPEGAAVQIMTGAPVPEGADAVVMVEHVAVEEGSLRLAENRSLRAGENVVPRGSEAHANQVLLPAGTRLGPSELALAASCGYAEILVYGHPLVAIIATGDELVELETAPGPEQIRNSNSYGLAALTTEAGGQPRRLAPACDTLEEIRDRVTQGRMSNLLVLSGGVSRGDYDLVEEVLAEFEAEFLFTGVWMQPGKPVVFGRLPERHHGQGTPEPECYFFGLPGNPISTQVTFQCFVAPMLRVLAGEPWAGPRWALARLSESAEAKKGLVRLLPGRMQGTEVRVLGWHGSGDLATNARANCYVELTADRVAGEMVTILLAEGR